MNAILVKKNILVGLVMAVYLVLAAYVSVICTVSYLYYDYFQLIEIDSMSQLFTIVYPFMILYNINSLL